MTSQIPIQQASLKNEYVRATNAKYWNKKIAIDQPSETMFLSASEAVARGAIEAGVRMCASYPGSPLTHVVDNLSFAAEQFPEMYVEWSTNEKIAYEVCYGGAMAGVRTLVPIKNVGMNWLMDPLASGNLLGVSGLVLAVGDDPGAETTQNEQDSRFLGMLAELPILEPSNAQEMKDYIVKAFEISEELKIPVMVRVMVRSGYARGPVKLGPIQHEVRKRKPEFDKDYNHWSPGGNFPWPIQMYSVRHQRFHGEVSAKIEEMVGSLPKFSHIQSLVNQLDEHIFTENKQAKVAVITGNLVSCEVNEAIAALGCQDQVSVLKLATSYPLPKGMITNALSTNDTVLVVEEIEPIIEDQVRAACADMPIHAKIIGKRSGHLPYSGELDRHQIARVLASKLNIEYKDDVKQKKIAERNKMLIHEYGALTPPKFCPGCPEHAAFYALKLALKSLKMFDNVAFGGDVGCYEMVAYEPFEMSHTGFCMGSGLSLVSGLQHSGAFEKVIAYVGDSTFFHAGMPALVNAIYNRVNCLLLVLDNRTTGETGHQPHPGAFGVTATGKEAKVLDIAEIAKAMKADYVGVCDPFDLDASKKMMKEALQVEGVAVVVARGTCALVVERQEKEARKKS